VARFFVTTSKKKWAVPLGFRRQTLRLLLAENVVFPYGLFFSFH